MPNTPEETRLNVRVKGPLAEHVARRIGKGGLYETPSEYIRDLIRHDMLEEGDIVESILAGLDDAKNGRFSSKSIMDVLNED